MKKILFGLLCISSTIVQASWWGELSKGESAGIIGGTTAVITGTLYNGSELQHQRKLERIDTEIRRNYETEAVIENAHRKYYNIGVPPKLQAPTYNSNQNIYHKNSGMKGKIIFNDGQKQIIRLDNGMNVVVE